MLRMLSNCARKSGVLRHSDLQSCLPTILHWSLMNLRAHDARYLSATGYLHANVKPFFVALPKVPISLF